MEMSKILCLGYLLEINAVIVMLHVRHRCRRHHGCWYGYDYDDGSYVELNGMVL